MAGSKDDVIHGVTGSGRPLPISGIAQETETALLTTGMGRADFASTTHPRMTVSSHSASKPLSVLAALDEVVARKGFLITADSSNSVNVMIGGKSVSSTNGMPLHPGQSLMIDITSLSKLYAINRRIVKIKHE